MNQHALIISFDRAGVCIICPAIIHWTSPLQEVQFDRLPVVAVYNLNKRDQKPSFVRLSQIVWGHRSAHSSMHVQSNDWQTIGLDVGRLRYSADLST